MKNFAAGFISALVIVVLGTYVIARSGIVSMATSAPPLPFEKKLAHLALRASIGEFADTPSSFEATPDRLVAGARLYVENCAVCHGLSGGKIPDIARGEFPRPPMLMPPRKGVTDDPAGETFWKIKNGIKMTGMPGYVGVLDDQKIWELSLFLLHADKLPAAAAEIINKQK